MNLVKTIKLGLLNSFDISYFAKFLFLFICLFNFHRFFVGITQPGNLYFPFLEEHLNYVAWVESSIIHTANILAHAIGINSHVSDPFVLTNSEGVGVILTWGCAGLGVMSFWFAFVVCDKLPLQKKFTWIIVGLLAIFFTNCVRVTSILASLHYKVGEINNMDHHQFFNNLSYAVLMLMIFFYSRKNTNRASKA